MEYFKCPRCKMVIEDIGQAMVICICGTKHVLRVPQQIQQTKITQQADPEAVRKINICKANTCRHYRSDTDQCLEVIRRGKLKDPPEERAGRVIPHLLGHPNVSCPIGYHDLKTLEESDTQKSRTAKDVTGQNDVSPE